MRSLAQFDGTADEDLLQFPLFADFGGNGQGTAGLLHVAGHVLMGRAGQGRGDGCRSAAAAVFPIKRIRIADVDSGNHGLFLRIAENQAVSREILAIDVISQDMPVFLFINAF